MAKTNNLGDFLTDIANTIRTKKGTTAEINAQNFSSEIASITTGIIPAGNINITNTNSTDVTNYATAKVVDANLIASNIKDGVNVLGITGTYDNAIPGIRYDGCDYYFGLSNKSLVVCDPLLGEGSCGGNTVSIAAPNTKLNYVSGPAIVPNSRGENMLIADNIKKDVYLLGVTGTYTSDATAVASDIQSGKTAYVNGAKITGTSTKITPSGNINITNTASTNVTNYATAKVVDSNLVASNIKKDTAILGITGTYEGSGGDTLKALLDYTKKTANMFSGYTTITDLTPYFSFNTTSNVTNMNSMYFDCTKLTGVPLFDTSKVTDMGNMFYKCTNLTTVPAFNTSNVLYMYGMFTSCTNLTTVPLFDTSKVTTMYQMFSGCYKLTTVPAFNTSNVTTMKYTFANCLSLTSIPALDLSKVTAMTDAFIGCTKLNAIHCVNINCDFDISASTKFTSDSLFEIFDTGLKQQESGVTKTLTIGSTNLAKLDSEYIAWASSKGWALA